MPVEKVPSLLERTMSRAQVLLTSLVDPKNAASAASTRTATATLLATSSSAATQPTTKSIKQKDVDWVAVGVELFVSLALTTASGVMIVYLSKRFSRMISGEDESTPANIVYARLNRILQKREVRRKLPHLNAHELQMAEEILDPDDIETSFADIGGLDDTKREIYELAILPLVQPELFTGKLVQPCKGILLYGKPGTGKTMLAKALAKEAQAVFLPLQLSKILNKWVGESNKLVAATFSLANKLQPAIIFIDELDTFLKANNTETAYLDAVKAEFLTLWDGVGTSQMNRVLVLGATNKPQVIDPAILRRMPRAFAVPLPDPAGRKAILELLLKEENVDPAAREFLTHLSGKKTNGYSGSDLKEMCKAAAMIPVQEITAEFARRRVMGERIPDGIMENELKQKKVLRPISVDDLLKGLSKVQRTGAAAMKYGRDEFDREEGGNGEVDENSLRSLLALVRSLSQVSARDGDDEIPVIR